MKCLNFSTKCLICINVLKFMRTNHLTTLTGSKVFRTAGLPLTISMPNYKVKSDKWHRHADFYELVIVCSGSACIETRIGREKVHSGNIYLFPDKTVHRYTEIKNFQHYNILFPPSLLNYCDSSIVNIKNLPGYLNLFNFQHLGEERYSKLNTVDESTLAKLISILEAIRNETTLWLPGWQENAYFEFMRMLVLLLRTCVPVDFSSKQNIFQIGKAIRIMEEDCTKDYTLAQLAKLVNMSTSCFRHNFTEITGIPPGEYLINLRLRKALLLLKFPNPIADIAHLAGFPNSNYFARIVRKRIGLTPRDIQKKYLSGELTAVTLLSLLDAKK